MRAASQVEQASTGGWVGPDGADRAAELVEDAMRCAVLDGGKRLRPLLVLAAEAWPAQPPLGARCPVARAACAVELIHAYSLVHDDMPCMDNDVLRRGKPTVHVKVWRGPGAAGGRRPAGVGIRVADATRMVR